MDPTELEGWSRPAIKVDWDRKFVIVFTGLEIFAC